MAAEDDKLEIVPDRTIKVRETRKLFRLAPAAENDLSRQVAIVAADTEDEAREVASVLRLRQPGNVGDPRLRRRDLSL